MAVDVTIPTVELKDVTDATSFVTGDFITIVKADGKVEILSYALFAAKVEAIVTAM